ncbi:MAG TPA: L-histidine N(alpha)-methyltransferase [Xanthomonadaceae bacterium]|nr:L-histidine N(alpha)-methyltransferase [Xanthomonadaceae bacterium]
MNAVPGTLLPNATVIDLSPDLHSVRDAVLAGLSATPRSLPAWLFYDAEGSRLFERICEQPEYYATRTELSILHEHGRAIAATLGEGCRLVELGSGSHRKARTLLRVLKDPEGYVAIDISGEQLKHAVTALAREFPELPVTGIVADYGEDESLPLHNGDGDEGRLVGFFPGSTIGNMEPVSAVSFLRAWAQRLSGGGMLVGVDLVKDTAVLDAAYNDAAGVTAAFNRNMLTHINRELGSDFQPRRFAHVAFFDPVRSRVEMHLESTVAQRVRICDRGFDFAPGERIHTENSCKYSIEGFQALAAQAGFVPREVWTDPDGLFSVHYLDAP